MNKALSVLLAVCCSSVAYGELKLWYDQPAREWIESLPVGNGRLLATQQGGVLHEVIQFNEDTIWSGRPERKDQPGGPEAIAEARRLLFAGEYKKAQQLVDQKVLTPHHAHGVHTYQTLGDLKLYFDYGDPKLEAENYRRELDLDRALSSVSYKMGEATYTRELFSSPVDQVVVLKLSCDQPGGLTFEALFSRPDARITTVSNDRIVVSGTATDKGNDQSGGVSYEAQIEFRSTGGILTAGKGGIQVERANEVEIRLAVATDYRGDDPHELSARQLDTIQNKSYFNLLRDHISEHQRLFRRVELNLVQTKQLKRIKPYNPKTFPTDKRIEAFRQGLPDPELVALYYQFGRYLLISASRPGTMPINLWGKWINTVDPWFNADYHTNINIPMNYWPAQSGNLAECNTPFFDLINAMRPNGRISAKVSYNCGGFVAHHATDAWLFAAAVGRSTHGMWTLTPAWGAHQMWTHYLYGGDLQYLENNSYPVMKEAAEFFVDYLIPDPKTGKLMSGPSCSPENTFYAPNGDRVSLSMAPTMDVQLIDDLFSNCIEASKVLNRDAGFRAKLEEMRARLQPMQIDQHGRLMEWELPFEESEPGHKHCSHLWGLCEGDLITQTETPELFNAALKSADYRTANGSAKTPVFRGNTAWLAQCYSRLHEGDQAYDILHYMIANSSYPNLFATSVQGLGRKMWETDANLGCTSAIAEMLVQSHEGFIALLPALPRALPDGNVKGLAAQGAFEVELRWKNGQLTGAVVTSLKGNACQLKYGDKLVRFKTDAGQKYHLDSNLEIMK